MVCHDNTDEDVIKILSLLRAAAQSNTTLIVGDHIMHYACEDPSVYTSIPGALGRLAPPPLLANFGKAGATATYMDLTVSVLIERHSISHI